MARRQYLVCLTILIIMLIMIEQSHGIYFDCEARCMVKARGERNRKKLKICREKCELLTLLQQEDAREGKHYTYTEFD